MPYCENCGSGVAPPPVNAQPTQPKRERLNYYSPPPPTAAPMPSPAPPVMHAPMAQASPSMQPAPVMPQVGGEATVGVILFRKPKSLGRWDPYTGVVTNQRLIFAQMTSEMLKAAVQQSSEQAKSQGKGFFGQWSDQLKATWGYSQKYLIMPPEAILAETPGNFALYNNTVSEIKVKLKGTQ